MPESFLTTERIQVLFFVFIFIIAFLLRKAIVFHLSKAIEFLLRKEIPTKSRFPANEEGPRIQISDYSEKIPSEGARLQTEKSFNPRINAKLESRHSGDVPGTGFMKDPSEIQRHDYKDLGGLLRQFAIKHPKDRVRYFWSPQILDKIMTPHRIADELASYTAGDPTLFSRQDIERMVKDIHFQYRKIFATLVLIGKGQCIGDFIKDRVKDEDLPLVEHEGTTMCELYKKIASNSSDLQLVECLSQHSWATHNREAFLNTQYSLSPAVLRLSWNGDHPTIRHAAFTTREVLPFTKIQSRSQGGFGLVRQVEIHPDCHEFNGVLKSIKTDNAFALKELRNDDRVRFEQEVDMLKRFNGFSHDHLVALLMTWTIDGGYYLLFPIAGSDLDEFWIKDPRPIMDLATNRWVAKQIVGMASALQSIHNPPSNTLQLPKDQMYGKHGDLKPENVLWYPSPTDEKGILVLADFGLTKLNSIMSRSITINKDKASPMEFTPRYKSPECDLRDGKMSRAYDIWTFGCLLLEFICWALEGQPARSQFLKELSSPYLSGSSSDMFFDIQEKEEKGKYVVLVKKPVIDKILELHQSPHCTRFFHEILYLIEEDMIVVLSAKKERISALNLHRRVADLYEKVLSRDPKYEGPCNIPRPAQSYDPVDAVFKYDTVGRETSKKTKREVHSAISQRLLNK